MKLYLAKEFSETDWFPHFRKIKKNLRKQHLPFVIRKLATEHGLLHSIWATEEHIDQVRAHIREHYGSNHPMQKHIDKVEMLAQEFEENWFKSICYSIGSLAIKSPIKFLAASIVVAAMLFYPFFPS